MEMCFLTHTQNMGKLTIASLRKQGEASLSQLEEVGFKRKFELGFDEHGYEKIIIIDLNNGQWKYDGEEEMFYYEGKAEEYWLIQT